MRTPLSDRARGRWAGLLPLVGVDPRYLSGKQGPCPMCGGKTRFRFDDREGRGTWICNHCGAGDGADLAMKTTGCDFRVLAERIDALLGSVPEQTSRRHASADECRQALRRLWRGSSRVTPGDPVALYLASRVDVSAAPDCIRTVKRLRYQDDAPSWHPAMIAMVSAPDGSPATIHRPYLTAEGTKAQVEAPRRLMPGSIPDGSAVRLFDPAPILGIAEGIETALAASVLFDVPVWAAVSAAMLAKWVPPDGVGEVIVFGDADVGFAGQAAAYGLAHRLSSKIARVRVELPRSAGADWNDVLREARAAGDQKSHRTGR
ncbi:P4 alpha zinc-binding domain protein [Methylobacterium sp. Leaf399]|uniref:DUF7146 domain-containing protein n=1 Tax=Methylobacterium sp. Leaf399 TaxID=1736364 RepID=UPI0006F72AF5|nr:toprim domain-containing protein [Methylobacterium sp. Leaf399]KQT17708.1 P4 alpha zinc-binding domain protein [Methylobacterium sp. Leaf399]